MRRPAPLREVALLALKIGTIGFGGPAAHIALLQDEVVRRRRWLDDREFLDLLGVTSLIPGPNSTEMMIHVGRRRAGGAGLVVGGLCFIAPAAAIVAVLSWLYLRYGRTPVGEGLLYGVKPVVIVIVLRAIANLGRAAVTGRATAAVGAGAFVLYLAGVNELVLLFAGGLVVLAARGGSRGVSPAWWTVLVPAAAVAAPTVELWRLGLVFLKAGALLYGSGYVLLAFLRNDLVQGLGWLTGEQLLDAVSVGQLTPGPVFTTATFIGYVLAGWPGAAVATAAIFLPSFIFVALTGPLIPRLRASPRFGAVLDGVNAAAVGLMAGVTVVLGGDAFPDIGAVAVGVVAAALVWFVRVNAAVVLLAGGAVGVVVSIVS